MKTTDSDDLVITIENLPFKMTLSKSEMEQIKPKIAATIGLDVNVSKEKLLGAFIRTLQENIKYEKKFELFNDKLKTVLEE
jgi:hypothetical protein